ncbi:MAG: 2OG-Fe(II) oxygenase [Pseudomonadota bacterium]
MLNLQALQQLDRASVRHEPFGPYVELENLITAADHNRLSDAFPQRERFERLVGGRRRHGQRPHNRFYLELAGAAPSRSSALESGTITEQELAPVWRQFIAELREASYACEVRRLFAVGTVRLRFTWHIAVDGDEVSPHRDLRSKRATHLFYFNTSPTWKRSSQGGETVLLGRKRTPAMNPEFEDFEVHKSITVAGNRSLLFSNSREAWHGVRKLELQAGAERRLFSVVFESTRLLPAAGDRLEKWVARSAELFRSVRTTASS